MITSSSDEVCNCVNNCNTKSRKCKKLLSIKINNKLNFNNHINEIWKKSRTEIKCTVKSYPLHELTEGVYVVECVFLILIQLSFINVDVS